MDSKVKILLDKIGIDNNNYQYFSDCKITRITISKSNDKWIIYLKKDYLLPLSIYEELEEKKNKLDEQASSIDFVFDIENQDLGLYKEYYKYLLKLLKPTLKVLAIYEDSMKIEESFLTLVATNEVEKERLSSCLEVINLFYKNLGYEFNIDVNLRHEDNIIEEIKKELTPVEVPNRIDVKPEKRVGAGSRCLWNPVCRSRISSDRYP